MSFEFSKTVRGKPLLILDGFTFIMERAGAHDNEKSVWRCTEYTRIKCLGRCHILGDDVIKNSDNHNHAPNHAKLGVRRVTETLKTMALESTQSTAKVLVSSTQNASAEVIAALPKVTSLKRKVQYTRSRNTTVVNPQCLNELSITHEYAQLCNGNKFLLYDSGCDEPNRVLIFGTEKNISFLKSCDHWYSDGTFKSAPLLFRQLFVILGQSKDCTLPVLYSLMENRTTECYQKLFQWMMDIMEDIQPATMMSDFELASRNAFKSSFPTTMQRGCFFHYMQSIWKHIRSDSKLYKQYKEDSYFEFHIRYLPALAFVKEDKVVDAFELILKMPFFVTNKKLLTDFVKYFEKTWIGEKRRSRRTSPLFAISLWNAYDSVSQDWDKTNNVCEGFNSGFQSLHSAQHPTIWKFIDGLRERQQLTDVTLCKSMAGDAEPPRKRMKTVALHDKLRKILDDVDNRSLEEYLKGIVCNIHFV